MEKFSHGGIRESCSVECPKYHDVGKTRKNVSNSLNTLYHGNVYIKTKTGHKKVCTVSHAIPISVFETILHRISQKDT